MGHAPGTGALVFLPSSSRLSARDDAGVGSFCRDEPFARSARQGAQSREPATLYRKGVQLCRRPRRGEDHCSGQGGPLRRRRRFGEFGSTPRSPGPADEGRGPPRRHIRAFVAFNSVPSWTKVRGLWDIAAAKGTLEAVARAAGPRWGVHVTDVPPVAGSRLHWGRRAPGY